MYPSSTLCHAQEALQRSRAAGASLANVRIIAEAAAAVWNKEGLEAEKREQRHAQVRVVAAARADAERRLREQRDRVFSENPDRGFENA